MGTRLLLSLAACALLLASTASAAGLAPNPANDRTLLDEPIEGYAYDEAKRCREQVPAGMKALERWLERNVPGESWGIVRCSHLRPGAVAERRGSWSVHAEGRAIDWHLDAGVAKERRAAMRLIRTLLMPDRNGEPHALARRMGVQGLIFDCKAWWSGMEELGRYSYCYERNGGLRRDIDRTAAHRDHVHLELNWDGARKRTSFWRSPVSR